MHNLPIYRNFDNVEGTEVVTESISTGAHEYFYIKECDVYIPIQTKSCPNFAATYHDKTI